tara:strand:+ start:1047 stop:3380 length:2334 start_codon:yes stop_codon:yes gene_type:complete
MELLFKQAGITLVIWAKKESLLAARNKLNATLNARSGTSFKSNFTIAYAKFGSAELPHCQAPFFFENKLYEFEFIFEKSPLVNYPPVVQHQSKTIEECFRYSPRTKILRGSLNFGNDIGRCNLTLKYYQDDNWQEMMLSFDVLPTKMDLTQDYQTISENIDKVYPLWRFALANKTTMAMGKSSKKSAEFELLWLAHFKQCQADFEQGIRRIINAPHSRLSNVNKACRLDQLSNRLSPKIEQKAKQAITEQQFDKCINITKQKLTVDTKENQFIKMALLYCKRQLTLINQKITASKGSKLSKSYIDEFSLWQKSISKQLNQPIWREVSPFTGLNSSSLVLQQRSGYAKVFRIWQILKTYLDKLEGNTDISVKSIAELYEVWCFIAIKDIIESLGFVEVKANKAKLKLVALELNFDKENTRYDALASSFVFERDDGTTLRLIHEPIFKEKSIPVKAWLGEHKPDILVEVSLPSVNGSQPEQFYWLFDAKYRIEQNKNGDEAPIDAIYQMHRYRDALIHLDDDNGFEQKSRPVFGAFALYPGFFQQSSELNPYAQAIEEIGIGAFALLPSNENQDNGKCWLQHFFAQHLCRETKDVNYDIRSNEQYFIQESVRIPYKGTEVIRYQGLTLVAPIIENGSRTDTYITAVRCGKSQCYHTQLLATNRQSIHQNIVREIQYLALAVSDKNGDSTQKIKYLYPVLNVVLKPRNAISVEMSGRVEENPSHDKYWVFTLGKAISLSLHVRKEMVSEHFEFKLTDTKSLRSANHWEDLKLKYLVGNIL